MKEAIQKAIEGKRWGVIDKFPVLLEGENLERANKLITRALEDIRDEVVKEICNEIYNEAIDLEKQKLNHSARLFQSFGAEIQSQL